MSDNTTKVIITGEDRTKAAFTSANRQMGDIKKNATKIAGEMKLVNEALKTMVGLLSLGAIKSFVSNSITEFNKAESAFRGLEAVANHTGVGIGRAMQEAEKLAADGLMTVAESSKALQNLLSRGYDVDQAVQTLTRLKDAAAFNRAASLSMGEAVVSASEGLKNENSILVDNAGLTKNVSVLWKEYAAEVGKSVTELTQTEKIQAEVAGVTRETAAQLGNAAKAANTLQAQMARLTVENQKAKAEMGQALQPVLIELTRAGTALVQNFAKPMIFAFQAIGIGAGSAGVRIGILYDAIKSLDFSDVSAKFKAEMEAFDTALTDAAAKLDAGLQFTPAPTAGGTGGGAKDAVATASAAATKAAASKAARDRKAAAAAALALRAEESTQAARLEQDDLARQIAANKQAFDAKLIDAADYYAALTELQRQQGASEIAALQAQRAAAEAVRGSDADQIMARADIVKIDAEIELIERRTADQAVANAASRIAVADALNLKQADFLDALEQEAFLAGLSNDERETALMLLEAEKLGITDVNRLLELQGQIRAANAEKDAAKETQRQQDDLYASVQQGVQKAFADGLNAIATGEGGIRGALQGVVDMLRNALGNAIAGSLTESFMGMLGGKDGVLNIAGMFGFGSSKEGEDGGGGLFGIGGKKGETPTNPLYVKDVAATGGIDSLLGGGEGEDGGGMFGGIGDIFTNMFSGIGNMLSGLFSSLMSGLGSLMSGLGGGLSGMMSGLGGLFGFADGGFTGAGGKYQPAGVVHAGEYVFSADSVRRLGLGALDNLHRIAKGGMIPRGPRLSYADGGLVNLPGSAAPSVTSNTKILNFFDRDAMFAEYLNTRGGERAILNVIQRNPGAAGA